MASRSLLLLLLALLISAVFIAAANGGATDDLDLDEDLSFLEEDEESVGGGVGDHGYGAGSDEYPDHDGGEYSDLEGYEPPEGEEEPYEEPEAPAIDEKDVVVLSAANFSGFVEGKKHVMVEFYAPWCGHCQAMAPEYAAAATELKGEDVAIAKVDATQEAELAERFKVQGFPTVLFFLDGAHRPYPGERTKDAIVTWIKKKIGPAVHNITTSEEAQKILASDSKVVLGFLDSLVGADSQELAAASKLEDDVTFYQTVDPSIAILFHIDPKVKRPSLVMLKKEEEKLASFEGRFIKSAIIDFVFANKLPLVTNFTRETANIIFDNPIKKQLLLFATLKDSEKAIPTFQAAAKLFKGKLIFVYVEMDNEDIGKPVSDYFGVTGDGPNVLGYTSTEDPQKFIMDGEVTVDNIKKFAEGFLGDELKPFYKSDPIPEINDGDVKIVVGNNFDEIVLDESKDVLLEIYAPWCGHCQALEPKYNKLAKHLQGIESLVIAKMDGTTNEHPRAKADGFPTLVFFPAGSKSSDPVAVDVDRTVVALYKFIKKHASIPFTLQKPAPAAKSDSAGDAAAPESKSASSDVKDEL